MGRMIIMMLLQLLVACGLAATILAEEVPLVPSASRDPPPIQIPIPTHHAAASVYSSYAPKGQKHVEPFRAKHAKKSDKKAEETDDLYHLFPGPIMLGVGHTNDDNDEDNDEDDDASDGGGTTTHFPVPIKIDIPLPPTYNHEATTHPPSSSNAVPAPSYYYYHKKSSKGPKSSSSSSSGKGSSYEADRDSDDETDRHPITDLPKPPEEGEEQPIAVAPISLPLPPPVATPVDQATYKSKGKKDQENDDDDDDDDGVGNGTDDDDENRIKPKKDKLTVRPTPLSPPADAPTINPATTTLPTSDGQPVIQSGTRPTPSTMLPMSSFLAAPTNAPDAAAPIASGVSQPTSPVVPPILAPSAGGPNPNPNGVPIQPATTPSGMPQPKTPLQPTNSTLTPQHSPPTFNVSTPASPIVAPASPPTATGGTPTAAGGTGATGSPVVVSTLIPTLPGDQTATGPPTVAPVLEIIGPELRAIQSDPVYLRIRGNFDPFEEEDAFLRNLEQLLGPYSRANVGSRLEEIQLRVDFVTETPSDSGTATTKRQKDVVTTVWTEVVVVYLISGESFFSTTMGTDYLRQFFAADNKQRLISQLRNDGIVIESIDTVEELPESLHVDDDNVLQPTDDGAPSGRDIPSGEQDDLAPEQSRKNRSSVIVAAVLSIGIVICALGAIVVANRRRRLERISQGVYDAQLNAPDKDDDRTPRHGNDRRRSTAVSSNSSITSFGSKKEKSQLHIIGETQSQNHGFDNDAALTDPDGDQSFCAVLHNEYSETDQDPPQSPVWSVGNYSAMSTPYSEEDYVVARRRWHQANDPDYIGLPDHHSVGGYEHSKYEASDDDGSYKAASVA